MTPGADAADSGDARSPAAPGVRAAFATAIALAVLYVALDAIAQALPPHYSPIRQAESDLAVGPYGYVMTVNFVVRGALSALFLYGLGRGTGLWRRSRLPFVLLGLWAVGAFVLAAFPTDVPPTPVSPHGAVHLVTAIVAFVGAGLGELLFALEFANEPRLRGIREGALAVGALAFLACLLDLFGGGAFPRIDARFGGLLERIFLGLALAWIGLVAAYYLRSSGRSDGASTPTTPAGSA